MFSYACPFCSQRLLAPPERAGQRTICPKCLRPLIIPSPAEAEEAPSLAAETPPAPPGPADDFTPYEDVPLSNRETPRPASRAATTRQQPQYAGGGGGPAVSSLPATLRRPTSLANRGETGMVSLHPTGLAAVDIGAELMATLSLRMKPPPEPPADLNVATGGWLLLSLASALTWVSAVIYDADLFKFVAVLGVLMVAFAYVWAVSFAGQRNWLRGAVTLLPPVTLWRLCLPFGENGYRPLRFALTGLLVLALYWVGPLAAGAVQPLIASLAVSRPESSAGPIVPPGERLTQAAAANQPEAVARILGELAAPEMLAATPANERPAVVAALIPLTQAGRADRAEVRVLATSTLAAWSPADARPAVLAALGSPESLERKNALTLAPRWPDAEIARGVAACLANDRDEVPAREALLQMPPAIAEAALIKLLASMKLASHTDEMLALAVADLLERVGGTPSVAALQELSRAAPKAAVRTQAARHAAAIQLRLDGPGGR